MKILRKIKNFFNFKRNHICKIGYFDKKVFNALEKSYELEKKFIKGV